MGGEVRSTDPWDGDGRGQHGLLWEMWTKAGELARNEEPEVYWLRLATYCSLCFMPYVLLILHLHLGC